MHRPRSVLCPESPTRVLEGLGEGHADDDVGGVGDVGPAKDALAIGPWGEVFAQPEGEAAAAEAEADLVVRTEVGVEPAGQERVVVGWIALLARPAGLQQRREDAILDQERAPPEFQL